jgi:hypothetical protein
MTADMTRHDLHYRLARGDNLMDSRMLHVLRSSLAALALLGTLTLFPDVAQAQWRVSGTGFGSSVRTLGGTTQSPVAALPADGGYATGESQTFGVPNVVDARWLTAVTSGTVDDGSGPASAQTVSEVENVNVLNGLVRAAIVTAIASSYAGSDGAGSNADGSGFVNLVVNGTHITTDVAPNTRIDIPLVGYVVLNEQVRSGDGASSTGIKLNMIHVRLLSGGEIILASASSSVTR